MRRSAATGQILGFRPAGRVFTEIRVLPEARKYEKIQRKVKRRRHKRPEGQRSKTKGSHANEPGVQSGDVGRVAAGGDEQRERR
jgi:hypothetical protein